MQTKLQLRSAEIKSQSVTYCSSLNKHDPNELVIIIDVALRMVLI